VQTLRAFKSNSKQKHHLVSSYRHARTEWIADALKANNTLLQIDFSNKMFASQGAKWIAQAIERKHALQILRKLDQAGQHVLNIKN
jgi:ribosomal protein L9